MCGINGCIHNQDLDLSIKKFDLNTDYLKHRGPDQKNSTDFLIKNNFLKFGHRRLSIIDLNTLANQPMNSYFDNFCIIFNGEIYNHLYLRKLISSKENIKWKTNGDTETLINLFEFFDIKTALNLIHGMFSFVLFDKRKNKLYFVKDRAGEKPLYISTGNNFFAFSSDLIALREIPGFNKSINKQAVSNYLQYNYIPTPLTIYENSFKLPSGTFLSLDIEKFSYHQHNSFDELIKSQGFKLTRWWNLSQPKELKKKYNYNNDKKIFHDILKKSVKSQLISDVPLGAFLSGGIDSSLIVSLMQEVQGNTKTFTIGYENDDYDESKDAKKISNYLGTSHTEYIFSQNDLINTIPKVNNVFSEPFADSSQIPTMLVSKIAAKDVKVVLSGDGGDELFSGYNRYLYAHKYWYLIKIFPITIRKKLIELLKLFPPSLYTNIISLFLPKNKGSNFNHANKVLNKLIKIKDGFSYYKSMTTEWDYNDKVLKDDSYYSYDNEQNYEFDQNNLIDSMMRYDFKTYLHDDILCKVDRSSMFYSLEVRTPFLSKDVINNAFEMPISYKINKNITKYILKDILKNYIPKEYIFKPKRGFSMPISNWMRNELKSWTNDLLSESINSKHNFFNQNIIDKIKNEHFKGINNHEHKLWSLIQFNSWYMNNKSN